MRVQGGKLVVVVVVVVGGGGTCREVGSIARTMVVLKCVVVGDPNVGKSTLIMNYKDRKCGDNVPDVVDACAVPVFFDGKSATLNVWDSRGHSDYDGVRPLLYPESDVCMVCYSVADPESYNNVSNKWIPELNKHRPNTPIVLVGTKTDLREELAERSKENTCGEPLTYARGEELAERIKAVRYIECSALTQQGVKHVFQEAARVASLTQKHAGSKNSCIIS